MDSTKERKITLGGVPYQYYEVKPDKGGLTMVFLHGIGVDKGWGVRRINMITCDCRKIFPDLPGHNGIPLENLDDMSEVALYINGLIEGLGLNTYVVAGYSLGGLIALKYGEVLRYDQQLRGIVSWASPILGVSGIRKEGRFLMSLVNSAPDRIYNMKSKTVLMERMTKHYGVKIYEEEIGSLSVFSKESAKKWLEIIDSTKYDLDPCVPAKIIFGTNDKVVADKNYTYVKNRCGKNVDVSIIENGGHMGSEEGVGKAFDEVSAFIKRVGNSEG